MTREEILNGLYEIKNWKCNGDAKVHEIITNAIEVLSEPTIPLSVIEKIHNAVDNADCDARLEDENGSYTEEVFTREHVHEIIYKVVKECDT